MKIRRRMKRVNPRAGRISPPVTVFGEPVSMSFRHGEEYVMRAIFSDDGVEAFLVEKVGPAAWEIDTGWHLKALP